LRYIYKQGSVKGQLYP